VSTASQIANDIGLTASRHACLVAHECGHAYGSWLGHPKGADLPSPTFRIIRTRVDGTSGMRCFSSNFDALDLKAKYQNSIGGPLVGAGLRVGLFGAQGSVEENWATVAPPELLARALVQPESSHADLLDCIQFPFAPEFYDRARALWALGLAVSQEFEMVDRLARLYLQIDREGEIVLTVTDLAQLLFPAKMRERLRQAA
jgi:hypothetical protein